MEEISTKDKEIFNGLATHPLQSWEWGEFRIAAKNKVLRFGIRKSGKLTVAGQMTIHKIPGTPYAVGAFIKGGKPTRELISALKDIAKKHNLIFIKTEPAIVPADGKDKANQIKILEDGGGVKGKTLFTPTTFWIDLTPSEDKLLESFSSKTRYNIRLAQKKGVTVREDNSDKAFEQYLKLTRETVERQGFYAHTEKYHHLMWKTLHTDMVKAGKEPIARLLTAVFNDEIITTWVLFVWHDFLYYPYGASTEKHKNVMANNLVMWEAIRYGKKLGLKTFDLWGREEGKGFTKFKEGYNPKVVEFLGTWDLVTSPLYPLYTIADSIRWTILRARTKFGLIKPSF